MEYVLFRETCYKKHDIYFSFLRMYTEKTMTRKIFV